MPVAGLIDCVAVAAGPNLSGAITREGDLFTWGKGLGLGHANAHDATVVLRPTRVTFTLANVRVRQVSFGSTHGACVSESGALFVWGSNRVGQLGLSHDLGGSCPTPTPFELGNSEGTVVSVQCCDTYSAALTSSGHLYTWGKSVCLGHETSYDSKPQSVARPTRVAGALLPEAVTQVSCGSLYMGCCCVSGRAYTWGYGGHGNLGQGSRRSVAQPALVGGLDFGVSHSAVWIACTVGQPVPGGGLNPKQPGQEGPHTLLIVADLQESNPRDSNRDELSSNGDNSSSSSIRIAADASPTYLYAFGTCHKGLCGNLVAKTLTASFDELLPYRVGSQPRDLAPASTPRRSASSQAKPQAKSSAVATAVSETKGSSRPVAEARTQACSNSSNTHARPSAVYRTKQPRGNDERRADKNTKNEEGNEDEGADCSAHSPGGDVEAQWPREQLLRGVVGCASASIHNLVWTKDGALWAFGCGSGGRCGVGYFAVGANPAKPRKSRMKAYMSAPNRVGAAWPPTPAQASALDQMFGDGCRTLEGATVRGAAATRYHGICLADVPRLLN